MIPRCSVGGRRIAQWAAIGVAINVLNLPATVYHQLNSPQTVKLRIPPADVRPLENADTHEVECYEVAITPVADVAISAMWPTFWNMYIVLGANIALFVWLLWFAVTGRDRSAHWLQKQEDDRNAVASAAT